MMSEALFLAHLLAAAATFAVATSARPFEECVLRRLRRLRAGAPLERACAAIGPGQVALLPALMIWLPVVPLVAWHALLLRADLSTAHFVRRANGDGLVCRRARALCWNSGGLKVEHQGFLPIKTDNE